jgi:hypothetical protein
MKEIKLRDKEAEFRFWGGDRMIAQDALAMKTPQSTKP